MELPIPNRTSLNLEPINSSYDYPPPPPYTEYDENKIIILQYNNCTIFFNIGEKNCISYQTCMLANSPHTRWYTTSTGNGIIGQTLLNGIPFYVSSSNRTNTIGPNYVNL